MSGIAIPAPKNARPEALGNLWVFVIGEGTMDVVISPTFDQALKTIKSKYPGRIDIAYVPKMDLLAYARAKMQINLGKIPAHLDHTEPYNESTLGIKVFYHRDPDLSEDQIRSYVAETYTLLIAWRDRKVVSRPFVKLKDM
jgi:hypothetical protein